MPQEFSRRDALRRLAVGGAATAALPLWVENLLAIAEQHTGHLATRPTDAAWTPKVLTTAQNDILVALTEAIIPETDTPGARGALVNRYIDQVLSTAPAGDRQKFLDGLAALDRQSQHRFEAGFAHLSPEQQIALLTPLSDAAFGSRAAGPAEPDVQFFRAARAMTIAGYYTSEIGVLQEIGEPATLAYAEFNGCTHGEHE